MASLVVLDTEIIFFLFLFLFLVFRNPSFFGLLGTTLESSSQVDHSFGFLGLFLLLSQESFQLVLPFGQVQDQSLKFSILNLEILHRLFEIHDAEINSEEG